MRFTAALVPLTLISGYATQVVGQLAVLQGVLRTVQADVEVYGDAFATGSASDIQGSGDDLLATIQAGTPTVQASASIGLLDAITLRTTFESLQLSVDDTYGTAIAQKARVDGLGITAAVHTAFVAQRAAVGVLGNALVSKVPVLVQGTARGYLNAIDATLARAIAAYA